MNTIYIEIDDCIKDYYKDVFANRYVLVDMYMKQKQFGDGYQLLQSILNDNHDFVENIRIVDKFGKEYSLEAFIDLLSRDSKK